MFIVDKLENTRIMKIVTNINFSKAVISCSNIGSHISVFVPVPLSLITRGCRERQMTATYAMGCAIGEEPQISSNGQ